MINVTLKVKHFYLLVGLLKQYPSDLFNLTLRRIEIAVAGKEDEELTTIQTEAAVLKQVYLILGSLPESLTASVNAEMNMLLNFFLTGADPEVQVLINEITTAETNLRNALTAKVAAILQNPAEVEKADFFSLVLDTRSKNQAELNNKINQGKQFIQQTSSL